MVRASARPLRQLFQHRLAEIGFEAKWTEPKVFEEELAADIALWPKLTKEAGIEPQ